MQMVKMMTRHFGVKDTVRRKLPLLKEEKSEITGPLQGY